MYKINESRKTGGKERKRKEFRCIDRYPDKIYECLCKRELQSLSIPGRPKLFSTNSCRNTESSFQAWEFVNYYINIEFVKKFIYTEMSLNE